MERVEDKLRGNPEASTRELRDKAEEIDSDIAELSGSSPDPAGRPARPVAGAGPPG